MGAMPEKTLPRLLKLWAVHLVFAAVNIPVSFLLQLIHNRLPEGQASVVSLALGLAMTAGYFITAALISARMKHEPREALRTGFLAALPFLLIIATAVTYLSRVPYNTIGYALILLPVTFPFQTWIEVVYPALPFHILALSVPLIVLAATVAGSCRRGANPG